MRRSPVFADPKTDFVFQRIFGVGRGSVDVVPFGSEDHNIALVGFLNDVLELDNAHRITSVMLLPPEALRHPPLLEALEAARTARFSREEWDAFIAAGKAIQNERAAFALARNKGELKGRRDILLRLLSRAGIALAETDRDRIQGCRDAATLDRWIDNVFGAKSAADVLS